FVDEHAPDALVAFLSVDGEGPHFGYLSAERCEIRADDDLLSTHDERHSPGVDPELVERARQEVPLLEVRGDQRVEYLSVRRFGPLDSQSSSRHAAAPAAVSAA